MSVLARFHPIVQEWFASHFDDPTDSQHAAWPRIAEGSDVLLAAPTGSGKTFAAFLVCLDRLIRQAEKGALEEGVQVVYVSPLKALSNDIERNLSTPLEELNELAKARGMGDLGIRVMTRTGDTPQHLRREMIKHPPHILVTTPESLYIVLTTKYGRGILTGVNTLIVDEIHTMLRDKRGCHLALTMARLDHVSDTRPQRIGLSATQRPIELTARFLAGADRTKPDGTPDCVILDGGHQRDLELAIELPATEMMAVMDNDQWSDIYDRLVELILEHKTTLIFVNTRKMAERLAHRVRERLGEDEVGAHHGSLSRERRERLEKRLKEGKLRALVATASLELGIDIGSIDLVCQIESPRSIATFLQRIGRSGHALGLRPQGRIFPTTRDGLLECAALVRAVRLGRLDALEPVIAPLDILVQQIVAEAACEEWQEDDLYACFRTAAPYADLERSIFDEALELACAGVPAGSPRGNAYVYRDRIQGRVRGRRMARQAGIEGGGAIPDTADFRVLAHPGDTYVGTLNEDFAIESNAGDIFLLGSTSWRILKVETGIVRVVDAEGAPPTIPFWFGEAPSRTVELSREVSDLRVEIESRLDDQEDARAWLMETCSVPEAGAEEMVRYIAAQKESMGIVPTTDDIVFERFFDDGGGMQLIVHAPYGGRINRAWGLALRKKFCRNFDFELQAAADENAFLLSLSADQSFAIEELFTFVKSTNVREAVEQAILPTPLFATRWRWNATRSLALLRQRFGKRVAPQILRLKSDDLLASTFPAAVQCQEHLSGPIEIPDHPLVRQTVKDCLQEAMDLVRLQALLERVEAGEVRLHARDTTEPSPFAHEILNSAPYTYLDDAPLEERRARAVTLRRSLPAKGRDLGELDPDAIAQVCHDAWPDPRHRDEVHDALDQLVALADPDAKPWLSHLEKLRAEGRASQAVLETGTRYWFVTENLRAIEAVYPGAHVEPAVAIPVAIDPGAMSEDDATLLMMRGHIAARGPLTAGDLMRATGLRETRVRFGIAALEAEGHLLRGRFRPGAEEEEVCDRRLLARIHRMTLDRLRSEIKPVSPRDFGRFLLKWQHVSPGTELRGKRGLLKVLQQLQGFEAPALSWERSILPARVRGYAPSWLDELCLTGELSWGRLSVKHRDPDGPAAGPPASTTLITLAARADLSWLMAGIRTDQAHSAPRGEAARKILALLESQGALFYGDIENADVGLPTQIEDGLWELVSLGIISADSFQALRERMRPSSRRRRRRPGGSRFRSRFGIAASRALLPSGRWTLLPASPWSDVKRDQIAEAWAEQLLERYGVVFRDVVKRERVGIPWRELLQAYRRMEARGTTRGGRFVTGYYGEQYAKPEAVEALRRVRKQELQGERVRVSAVDPLNLVGILTEGARIPSIHTNHVLFVDGQAELPSAAERHADE